MNNFILSCVAVLAGLAWLSAGHAESADDGRRWLAGDHHIHSEFSVRYLADPADPTAMPVPAAGGEGVYAIEVNAQRAAAFGLHWMVSTDHGGPGHSRVNHDLAYPALLRSRQQVPGLLQFFGMEFDTPGGDHSSLIVPHTHAEREQLRDIESRFARKDAHPPDPARDTPEKMLEALRVMREQLVPPVIIANHPSRSARFPSDYGKFDPAEFRDWNDTAPEVAVGMEGAPGYQAAALDPSGQLRPQARRGNYTQLSTLGGFDPMAARLGGLWDALLGEGRRWWITATSDSHLNWRDGGPHFWPGEYSRTYVLARHDYGDVLDGLRRGRMFVTTGDLVSEVDVVVRPAGGGATAGIGGTLVLAPGENLVVEIRLRDPAGTNVAGRNPVLARVDLIVGEVRGAASSRMEDRNPTTRVLRRFGPADWQRDGEWLSMREVIERPAAPLYLRLRGTSTAELEPEPDPEGEDPWADLWFYTSPVFVELRR